MIPVKQISSVIRNTPGEVVTGTVIEVHGPIIRARIPKAAKGDLCTVDRRSGQSLSAQVVGFSLNSTDLAPFDYPDDIIPGAPVRIASHQPQIYVNPDMIGTVVDALGLKISTDDSMQDSPNRISQPLFRTPPPALSRQPVSELLCTGVSAIDTFCTIGYGQRVAMLAPAGTGKSSLLGMIARNAEVDLTVAALVGERGREVGEFLEEAVSSNRSRTIVVVSTSDEHPMRRLLAPYTATAIAEYFRDRGNRVLLLVDSLTRTARALREIGLASGEIPVRHGYPASVFSEMPRLLERCGSSNRGSITAIYTLLTEGAVENDPLAQEIKSLLDGHIVLSQTLAEMGIYPAVDPIRSLSRLLDKLHSKETIEHIRTLRRLFARLEHDKDIITFGGSPDPELASAVKMEAALHNLLRQSMEHSATWNETNSRLCSLSDTFAEEVRVSA